MASIYNRAAPSQARVLRIVEGAVKNAADAHPDLQISPRHRRSIAKRAAGTLTAQWPDVLAARASSGTRNSDTRASGCGRQAQAAKLAGRGGSDFSRTSPLQRLVQELSRPLRDLKLAGETAKVEARIEVLQIIAQLRRPANPDASDGAHDAPRSVST